ncbi:MAG TPA: hypothetical protein VIM12_20865 [Noviherbaspirillum sp.]|jgi:hypothetical protein|uniref:hypothetical protein n=1 Tax=Noviherbaspirillum sp. TaxID=1926288 RepID=UPI002F938ED7
MANTQDWRTETYKGMEVHVTPLPRDGGQWDFSVRVGWPGEDSSTGSELNAAAGDDADYPSREAAVAAGFAKGYRMVDEMLP